MSQNAINANAASGLAAIRSLCVVTGHPVGSDTHEVNHPCQCEHCRAARGPWQLTASDLSEEELLALERMAKNPPKVAPGFEPMDLPKREK